MIIYREDKKMVKALGGMDAMRDYPVHTWATKGQGQYKKHVPQSWNVPDKVVKKTKLVPMDKDQAKEVKAVRTSAGKKAAETYQDKIADINMGLGLLPGSKTGKWLARGEIDEEAAIRVAQSIKYRHEETDYDDMLNRGIDKDTAREIIQAE